MLLGVAVFTQVLCHGQRSGPAGTPSVFETVFGWVLSGRTDCTLSAPHVATRLVLAESGNDVLHKFWELEEQPKGNSLSYFKKRVKS